MAEVTTLADIPNDMFSNFIFPLFQHDRSTLLNLALVSRRFKDLAQPLFYRTITLSIRAPTKEPLHPKPWPGNIPPGNIHIFDALVSTLNAHPYLGSYVLSLSISVCHHPYYTRFHSHSALLSLTHNLRSLELDPPPATLSLAASDYPHLNTLRFDFSSSYNKGFPVIELQPQVQNLQLVLVARHFFLRSLRNFKIEGLCFSPRELGPVLFPAQLHSTSQIESLELLGCGTDDIGCLPDMLKCIKSLQRFVFEVHEYWEVSHTFQPRLTARSLAIALKAFQHELRQLCVAASDAADFLRGSMNTFSVNGRVGKGFREYENLTILAVPEFFLVNDRDSSASEWVSLSEEEATESVRRFLDFLPQSIEYLQIQYMHGFQQGKDPHREVRIRRLKELARRKGAEGASFGKLKKVVWWMQMAECWSDAGDRFGAIEQLVALKEVFYHVGVDFEWVSVPYWEDTPFGEGRFGGDGKLPNPQPQSPITSIRSVSIH